MAKATKKSAQKSMPEGGRNPKGGLTQKGREFFAQRDGLHLKPGVTGAADTPEKMKRKGSFLVRTFSHPRGPMLDPKGQPTRLALSAHAWGEQVPKTIGAAHKLAAKGHTLLAKFHSAQDKLKAKKTPAGKAPRKGTVGQSASAGKAAGKKAAGKKTSITKAAGKKAAGKKTAAKRTAVR